MRQQRKAYRNNGISPRKVRNVKPKSILKKPERGALDNISCRIGNNACATKHTSAIQRPGFLSPMSESMRNGSLLRLQRHYGNRFVQRVIAGHAIQAKLKIGQPGDKYEQEADRVAEQVMQMPEPKLQRQPEDEEEEEIQPKTNALIQMQALEEEEEAELQAKNLPGQKFVTNQDVEERINAVESSGHPLSRTDRIFFETRFGRDFSQVRVHTDTQAAEASRAENARAFTKGRDIVFANGQYSPGTPAGKKLLAHELAHVVQQTGSDLPGKSVAEQVASSHIRRIDRKTYVSEPIVQRQKVGGGSKASDQLPSWSHPHGKSPLIGQIFFATNSVYLSPDDKVALRQLIDAFEEHGDAFMFDPIGILFLGHADPRSTTYPDGNEALAQDRADVCDDFFLSNLSGKAKKSVKTVAKGRSVDPALAKAGLNEAQQRMVAIMRPFQKPIPTPTKRRPAPSRKAALKRCRSVLRTSPGSFSPNELRHLKHICRDATVRDGFLNGMDRELVKIAYGMRGKMTDEEARKFANRFKVRHELMHPSAAGPDSNDLDVIGALKGLHSRIQQGMDHLALGLSKDMMSGKGNQRRQKLSQWVDRSRREPKSVYFNW